MQEYELQVEVIGAKGQRCMCHGWNGANTFTRKGCGLGTFDDFTNAEWCRAEDIADEVAHEVIADFGEREIEEDREALREAIEAGDEKAAEFLRVRLTEYHGCSLREWN